MGLVEISKCFKLLIIMLVILRIVENMYKVFFSTVTANSTCGYILSRPICSHSLNSAAYEKASFVRLASQQYGSDGGGVRQ